MYACRPPGSSLVHVLYALYDPLEDCRDADEANLGTGSAGVVALCDEGSDARQGELVTRPVTSNKIRPCKVVLYRDTGSVEPGSRPFFGSVSGSEIQILGILLLYLYLCT